MIPKADIVAWRRFAPWINDAPGGTGLDHQQGACRHFQSPLLAERLIFRGRTPLHQFFFDIPRRYSEEIDLVQIIPAPIGQVIDSLQELLNGFLGAPRRKQTEQSVILTYRMESEGLPVIPMRLKEEINTRGISGRRVIKSNRFCALPMAQGKMKDHDLHPGGTARDQAPGLVPEEKRPRSFRFMAGHLGKES